MTKEIVYIGYTGGLGGEAMQMFELASGVAERGWNVTVVVPEMPGLERWVAAYGSRPNMRVVTTPHIIFDTGMQRPADVLSHLKPYVNAPFLHLHTGDICLPRLTTIALEWLRPRRAFVTIHAALPEMMIGSPRARYWASATRRLFRAVFCPSEQGRQTQLSYGVAPDRAVTIHNGVDVAHYAAGNAAAARARLGVGPEIPLIVATSRLHPQKRPWDALDAFARIAQEPLSGGAAAHLVFVGDGPLEKELREQTARLALTDRVHFVGLQTNIPDWLAAATVWLFPSQAEHASLSLLEALSAGCAVVATHCPGNDEALRDGENALTADIGDTATLAIGLRRLLNDSDLRAYLGAAGRQTAARFSREIMVDGYIAAYLTAAEK